MIVQLPTIVHGPALVRGEFSIGEIELREYYVRKGESVTVQGSGTVAILELPPEHTIDTLHWGFQP